MSEMTVNVGDEVPLTPRVGWLRCWEETKRLETVIEAQNDEIARLNRWANVCGKMRDLLQELRGQLAVQQVAYVLYEYLPDIDEVLGECERADEREPSPTTGGELGPTREKEEA